MLHLQSKICTNANILIFDFLFQEPWNLLVKYWKTIKFSTVFAASMHIFYRVWDGIISSSVLKNYQKKQKYLKTFFSNFCLFLVAFELFGKILKSHINFFAVVLKLVYSLKKKNWNGKATCSWFFIHSNLHASKLKAVFCRINFDYDTNFVKNVWKVLYILYKHMYIKVDEIHMK